MAEQADHVVGVAHQRAQQAAPRGAVLQAGAGALEILVCDRRGPPLQWVGVGDLRHRQPDAARSEVELGEER